MNRKIRKLIKVIGIEAFCLLLLTMVWFVGSQKKAEGGEEYQNMAEQVVTPTDPPIQVTPVPTTVPTAIPTAAVTVTPEPTVVLTEETEEEGQEGTESSYGTSNYSVEEGGVDEAYIATLSMTQPGSLIKSAGAVDVVYYMQTDDRWGSLYYGDDTSTDTIAKYGCGPTSMAIVVSSLTDIKIDPVQMCAWAAQNHYWYPASGSLHSLIPDCAKAFGLKSEGVINDADAAGKITKALSEGKLIVALMGKGHFTSGGHFIVLRGITEDGKILVADANSEENTNTEWDVETITSEAKAWANANGPFWIISK
ncbi:MAG: murein hydrolase [Lachnospiraceae bacterium]|nr:murein hydrolase [Lachnospiraceae bacterium]